MRSSQFDPETGGLQPISADDGKQFSQRKNKHGW